MSEQILLVHPARYEQLRQAIQLDYDDPRPMIAGCRIVQYPYAPLTTTVRVRRWLPPAGQGRWYRPRRYRLVQQPVLGLWVDATTLRPKLTR